MEGSVSLGPAERKRLMEMYRRHPDPAVRHRAHIVLLLADGRSWSWVESALYCSRRTIDGWKKRYERGGAEALVGQPRGRRPAYGLGVVTLVVTWVTTTFPRDFGFVRSRWTCECLAVLVLEFASLRVIRETVRRWLHRENLVWRRPRPVLGPKDPERALILRRLRLLLRNLPPDETAVFQDEVDINTNPKIGCLWMRRGDQAEVETPGTNEKRRVAGSLNWRTGHLIVTEGLRGEGRSSVLFTRHLEDLRTRLRCYRRIHVICDNASFHDSRVVRQYLAEHGDRLVIHFLPKYAPDLNPIERIWWHLHEEITRNHRCRTMDDLLDLVFE
jgi:transposase